MEIGPERKNSDYESHYATGQGKETIHDGANLIRSIVCFQLRLSGEGREGSQPDQLPRCFRPKSRASIDQAPGPIMANAPGGKVINAAAFSMPTSEQGNLGRNALRGFGATQWDNTLRRQFGLTERLSLQVRGDLLNILNHPNFGSPINYLSSPQIRAIHPDAQRLAGRWRSEWWP